MSLPPETIGLAWRAGVEAYPQLPLAREDLAEYLEARAGTWGGALEHAADLYLACACLCQVQGAAATFLARFLDRVPAYLGRLARGTDFVSEVQQRLSILVLVAVAGDRPKIEDYTGRGPLEGWVRVVAVRVAHRLMRGEGRRKGWELLVEPRVLDAEPDLEYLKGAYREPFRRAFANAVAALGASRRVLLRLHYVEGMTTARLAQLNQMSRPTIVRRIGEARAALVGGIERELRAALRLSAEELDSLLHLIRSQIDVSLTRLLRDSTS